MFLPNILRTNDTFQGCEYNKEKVLNIDVDKILGLKGNSEVNYIWLRSLKIQNVLSIQVRDAVNSEFEFSNADKTIDQIKEEAIDQL